MPKAGVAIALSQDLGRYAISFGALCNAPYYI